MAPLLDHGGRDQRRWEISIATCVLAASASASLLAVHRQRRQQQQERHASLDSTAARADSASQSVPTMQSAWGNLVSVAHDIRSTIQSTTKPLLDFGAAAFNRTRAPAQATEEAPVAMSAGETPSASISIAPSEQTATDVKPHVVIPPLVFTDKRDSASDEAFEDSIRNTREAWGVSKSPNPPTDLSSSADGVPATSPSPSHRNRRNYSARKHEEVSSRGYAVTLGDLKVWISHEYEEEAAVMSHPLYMRTFVRDDGTQITLAAEDLSSIPQSLDTPAYRARCVEKARQAALEKQTYFKVKLNIDANAVVTSVFEQFVDLIIGPGPVDAASFFIVSGHVGYTLQMQAELGAYESRLAEFLTTVQGARLTPIASRFHGANHHTLSAADKSEVYRVVMPPQFLVKRSGEGMLAVQFRHRSRWKGEVLTWKPKLTGSSSDENDVVELVPEKLFFASKLSAVAGTPIGSEITGLLTAFVRGSIVEAQAPQSGSTYISDIWTLPLPPIDTCITNVCEHLQGSGVTLFIETKNEDQVEVVITAAYVSDVGALKSEISAKISPSPKLRSKKDSRGRNTIHAEGKSMEAPYAPVGIDAMEYSPGLWVTITWTFPESAAQGNAIPSELARYPAALIDELAFRELPIN